MTNPRVLPGAILAMTGMIGTSFANPAGPNVAVGSASVTSNGDVLSVVTGTNRTVINWDSFSIGSGELTSILQPGANSATLNRVVGAMPTEILGTLQSNGKVAVINEHGILVGKTGIIDTRGFIGSTLDIADANFAADGNLTFSGNSAASVKNAGLIVAREGDVFLLARQIENSGSIRAEGGNVGLAAGGEILLRKDGDDHVFVEVAESERGNRAVNSGDIEAIQSDLRANGNNPYQYAMNTGDTGVSGMRVLPGGGVELTSGNSGVTIQSGSITASRGDKGGSVELTGGLVDVTPGARIDASGTQGGGSIKVGGGFQGNDASLPNASITRVQNGAVLDASAAVNGDGGEVIVWADDATFFYGDLMARGAGTGDGGFAEVSGKGYLDFAGGVNLSGGTAGAGGTLLLDPTNVIIQAGSPDIDGNGTSGLGDPDDIDDLAGNLLAGNFPGTSIISAGAVETRLAGGNLRIEATNDITVSAPITWGNASNLTLDAGRNLTIGAAISNTGSGNLNLLFGQSVAGELTLNGTLGGDTFVTGGSGNDSVLVNVAPTGTVNADLAGGMGDLVTLGGSDHLISVTGSKAASAAGITWTDIEAIDAAGGSDTLTTSLSSALTGTSGQLIAGGIALSNLETLAGGGSLAGSALADAVLISGIGTGSANGVGFSGLTAFNAAGGSDSVQLTSGADSISVTGASSASAAGVAWTNIEAIDTAGGNDTLTTSLSSVLTGASAQLIAGGVTVSNLETLTGGGALAGSAIADTVLISGMGAGTANGIGFSGLTAFDAAGGSDTLTTSLSSVLTGTANRLIAGGVTVSNLETLTGGGTLAGSASADTVLISGNGAGTANGIEFSGLNAFDAAGGSDSAQLTGGADSISVTGANAASAAGIAWTNLEAIDTAGGSDTLATSLSSVLTGTVNQLIASGITVSNLETLTGGGTLAGSALADTVLISGMGAGTANGIGFSGLTAFDAAGGNDVVTLTAGSDMFLASGLFSGSSNGIAFSNIETINGGAGTDVFDAGGLSVRKNGGVKRLRSGGVSGMEIVSFESFVDVALELDGGDNNFTVTGNNSGFDEDGVSYTDVIQLNGLGGTHTLAFNVGGTPDDLIGLSGGTINAYLMNFLGFEVINSGAGDDTLNVSGFSGIGNLAFNGGSGANAINITDSSSVAQVVHNFLNASDGSIVVGANTLNYTGLAPIFDNLNAASRVFNFLGGAETISLGTGGTLGMQIDSTLGEVVDFVSPTTSLTVNAGSGDDSIGVSGLTAGFGGALNINGEGGNLTLSGLNVANPSTTVSVTSDLGLIASGSTAGVFSLAANGGVLATNGNLGGANINLTGRDGIALAHNVGATGNLVMGTTNSAISQTAGVLTVGAATAVTTGTGDITLLQAGNDFTGVVTATGNNIRIVDTNALSAAITAGGLGELTATTRSLTAAGTTVGSLTTASGLGTSFGTTGVGGNLVAAANGGNLAQTGAVTVSGTSDLDATGDIVLTNGGNDFGGAVDANGVNVSVSDSNNLSVSALVNGVNGQVSLLSGGTLFLPAQPISAGSADLTLSSNGGPLTTSGNLSGTNINLTGRDGIALAHNVGATGNLVMGTTNSAINQTAGVVTVTGATTATAGTGDITLLQAGNDFTGVVSATGNNIRIVDTNALSAAITAGGLGELTATTGSLTASGTTVGSLTTASGLGTSFGTTGVGGNLVAAANGGNLAQTGAVTVSGTSDLDATQDIVLGDVNNDFVGVVDTAAVNVTLADRNSLTFGDVNDADLLGVLASGNLVASALGGDLGQTHVLSVTGTSDLNASQDILLGSANLFGGVVDAASGRDATVRDADSLTFGDVNDADALGGSVGRNLIAQALGGNLGQTDEIEVTGTSDLDATQNIVLGDVNNDFGGVVDAAAVNATLTDRNSLTFGDVNDADLLGVLASGNLVASALGGDLGQTHVLSVTGTSDLNASQDIVLGSANLFGGVVDVASGRDATVRDADSLTFGDVNDADALGASVGRNLIAQALGGNLGQTDEIEVSSTSDLDATQDIVLGDVNNDFGGVVDAAAVNITLADRNSLTFGDVNDADLLGLLASGNLVASALGGDLGQTQVLSVTGTSDLNASQDILLGSANLFGGVVDAASGRDATVRDAGSLTFGDVNDADAQGASVGRNLIAQALGGNLGQTEEIEVSGTSDLDATQDIVLTNPANFFDGLVDANAVNVSIVDADGLGFSAVAATGNFAADANGGSLTQTGVISVDGTSDLDASADIVLSNPNNLFDGLVDANAVNVNIADADSLGFSAVTATGNFAADANGGSLTQTGVISVDGTSDLDASANIVFNDPNNLFDGLVDATGVNVSIADTDGLGFSGVTATGNLAADANGGSLTQTGVISVDGTSDLDASADIVLSNPNNLFDGLVDANAVNVSIADADALSVAITATGFGDLTAGGALGVSGSTGSTLNTMAGTTTTFGTTKVGTDLVAQSGGDIVIGDGVSDADALAVLGNATLKTGTGDIRDNDGGPGSAHRGIVRVGGLLTLEAGGGGDISLIAPNSQIRTLTVSNAGNVSILDGNTFPDPGLPAEFGDQGIVIRGDNEFSGSFFSVVTDSPDGKSPEMRFEPAPGSPEGTKASITDTITDTITDPPGSVSRVVLVAGSVPLPQRDGANELTAAAGLKIGSNSAFTMVLNTLATSFAPNGSILKGLDPLNIQLRFNLNNNAGLSQGTLNELLDGDVFGLTSSNGLGGASSNEVFVFQNRPVIDLGLPDVAGLVRSFFRDALSDETSLVDVSGVAGITGLLGDPYVTPPAFGPFAITSYEYNVWLDEVSGRVAEENLLFNRRFPLYLKRVDTDEAGKPTYKEVVTSKKVVTE